MVQRGLKEVEEEEQDSDHDMIKWSVCVKENEDDDEWDALDNLFDTKGKAKSASAKVRDEYDERKVIKVRFSSLD